MRGRRAFWRGLARVDAEIAATLVGESLRTHPLTRILVDHGA
jgi:hypothetical protein